MPHFFHNFRGRCCNNYTRLNLRYGGSQPEYAELLGCPFPGPAETPPGHNGESRVTIMMLALLQTMQGVTQTRGAYSWMRVLPLMAARFLLQNLTAIIGEPNQQQRFANFSAPSQKNSIAMIGGAGCLPLCSYVAVGWVCTTCEQ
jgi:hypothetical protein